MLFAVSDVVWQALIAAAMTIIMAYMSQRTKDAVAKTADAAAGKAEEVKTTLAAATAQQDGKLDRIHTLVNSNMGVQLRMTAELARWKAVQTRDPKHIAEAENAERLYREHVEKQAAVDAADQKGGAP